MLVNYVDFEVDIAVGRLHRVRSTPGLLGLLFEACRRGGGRVGLERRARPVALYALLTAGLEQLLETYPLNNRLLPALTRPNGLARSLPSPELPAQLFDLICDNGLENGTHIGYAAVDGADTRLVLVLFRDVLGLTS